MKDGFANSTRMGEAGVEARMPTPPFSRAGKASLVEVHTEVCDLPHITA